jgi:hypothetical protein
MTKIVEELRALAEMVYGGQTPSLSAKRAALLSQAADEIELLESIIQAMKAAASEAVTAAAQRCLQAEPSPKDTP